MYRSIQINLTVMTLFTWIVFSSGLVAATTRSDVRVLEASEEIKFISQKVVKEYFYRFKREQNPTPSDASLKKIVSQLDEKLRLIATATKSDDARNLLNFLSLSSERIGEIVSTAYSMKNAAMMMDYSETLLEGARSLIQEHSYDFSLEEQMFIRVKNMAYLLERINKYYLAYQSGFIAKHTFKELHRAIDSFDKELKELHAYGYKESIKKDLEAVSQYWHVVRAFYFATKKRELPNILYISTIHLESILERLALFHSKNQ